jgi:HlyD family secretion protein
VLRRPGLIQPLKEERTRTKLAGTILEIANEGDLARKDDIVLKLDPVPHEDLKAQQEELIAEQAAEYKRASEESLKGLNLAREDVNSFELRLELEQMRLDEIKKGPTPADEINAQVDLENNQNLYKAKQEETDAIGGLAKLGYAAQEEFRQKQLETVTQNLKVVEMDIAHRKLNLIDAVKLAEQEMKVKEARKTRDTAKEKVLILEKTIKREEDRYNLRKEHQDDRLKELVENLTKTVYRATCDGVVIPRRTYYGFKFAPGREVFDGQEILTIPDLSKLKVKLCVDEGRIAKVTTGMRATVIPAGWTKEPFKGTVIKISEQGRDEFEQFQEDTLAISGTANRKVFDVDIELQGTSDALRLGLRCDVEIVLGQIENAIVVPRAALIRQKDGDVLVSVLTGSTGAVEQRKIKVNAESELWAAIEGVKEGERVLLSEQKAN